MKGRCSCMIVWSHMPDRLLHGLFEPGLVGKSFKLTMPLSRLDREDFPTRGEKHGINRLALAGFGPMRVQ